MKKLLTVLVFLLPVIIIAQPPAGYYNSATGLNCSALKTALKNIVTNGHIPKTYADLWTVFLTSDIKPREVGSGSANVIWDMYSDNPAGTDPYNFTPSTQQCGNYNSEADCYNREHSFPASWFDDEAPAYTDLHHIFPTDGFVNNVRGNLRFGEVAVSNYVTMNGSKRGSSATAGITGTVFEPLNEYKGDFARAYLYMVTRYEDRLATWNGYATDGALTLDGSTYPAVDINYLRLMLKWHNQDPVSQKEIDRNNAAYNFQSNRNPYVDFPQYANQVWNASCPGLSALPVEITLFSGKLNGNVVALNWTVATEINFDRYDVERSFNGVDYAKIAAIKAEGKPAYNFNDNVEHFTGRRIYYRLKLMDKDGKYAYSAVFTLHVPLNTNFTVSPNPATNEIRMQLNSNTNQTVAVSVTDATGRLVFHKYTTANNGLISVPTASFGYGSYMVKLILDGEVFTQRVLVIK